MPLTIDEIVEYRTDLLSFSKYMFKARKGFDFVENWHHKKICEALERVFIGQIKRLIINIPPRYSKTELAVVNFMSWALGNYPDCEFIHASYSKRLAANNTFMARSIVMDEAYSDVFGNIGIRHDSKAKDEWRTDSGGCVYAAGTDGTITGYGAGKLRPGFGGAIIIDDPHKAGEANSERMRQNVIDWFGTTIESRTNSPDTPVIVIMQRLHEEDLAGWLSAGGNGEEWEVLNIPAVNDNDEALWPFKHTREKLAQMEASNPFVFAGQYMQRPSPKGGGMFKDEWWRTYDHTAHIPFEWRAIFGDTAQKTGQQNDYTTFQCWGYFEGRAYLIDQFHKKVEAPELLSNAEAFWAKHVDPTNRGYLRAFYIEDKVSGTGLIQQLVRKGVPVEPVSRSSGALKGDKISRANDVLTYFKTGLVVIPEAAPWVLDYRTEFGMFPNGAHDDQIDPSVDAVMTMLGGSYSLDAWG